jgi:GNAT superfamily N-acetyltransferase
VRIEKARASDERAIRALYAEGEDYLKDAPANFRDGSADRVLEQAAKGLVLVAREDIRVQGFVCIGIEGQYQLGLYLIVSKEARGSGIGLALVKAGHELAKLRGAKLSICQIWPQSGVQQFYEKAGYREICRTMEAVL